MKLHMNTSMQIVVVNRNGIITDLLYLTCGVSFRRLIQKHKLRSSKSFRIDLGARVCCLCLELQMNLPLMYFFPNFMHDPPKPTPCCRIDRVRSLQSQWVGPYYFSVRAGVDFDGKYADLLV